MMTSMSAYCLEMHAEYLCRHAGACCTAGWHIPVEQPVANAIARQFGGHRRVNRFVDNEMLPEGAVAILAVDDDGACVFFEGAHGRLCEIHRDLGPSMLPSACRHFPRVVLNDARGTLITLSHFCPTAAGLLFDLPRIRIVSAPPSLSLEDTAEGLDARHVLPPLLRPGMLTDMAGYDAWERACLSVLDRAEGTADDALARIEVATRRTMSWTPARGSLAEYVREVFDHAHPTDGIVGERRAEARRIAIAVEAVPPELRAADPDVDVEARWEDVTPIARSHDRTIRAFLAAKLFANWIAYHGRSLLTIVESLRVCASVLRVEMVRQARRPTTPHDVVLEAIRATDLRLVHQADSRTLARLIDHSL
jgi:Fe-S-cluster containining protein